MTHYKYLILGGGMAGDAAVRGIHEVDPAGTIGMIGREPDAPYTRPLLSKGLWKGKPFEQVWRGTEKQGVSLHLGSEAVQLDVQKKQVKDDQGNEYTYDKLLLATGGTPNRLPFGGEEVIYFRELRDYQRLRGLADDRERFLVVGGSFIGSEIAAALTMVGKKVTLVSRHDALADNIFPKELAEYLNDYYREKGVELVSGDEVTGLEKRGERYLVRTKEGRTFDVDGVVAGLGIRPNVDLAREAALEVKDGIVVDEHAQTSAPDVYAAGDAAMFYHATLGKQTRVEHEDNALKMGLLAGHNMAGAQERYTHVPYFYSDLFELGYEAVGELSSKLETVIDWQEPFKKGVIYYLDQGRVRGVLLWDVWKQRDAARALLAEAGPFTEKDLKGKISG
ncbi:MAG TPA: FAD-dependent oxidoreductase [Anaerolineales bacterium]|jgi:NADPH-dependent 2,4-dienoyl-CoA reductase/sulfur reductase-like enzyme